MIEYRQKRLSWNDKWGLNVILTSQRSPDPNTQVASIFVKANKLLSEGYNGAPKGIHPSQMPWNREGENNKYLYIVHAEQNAILNARYDLEGSTCYVSLHPCSTCMKSLIQVGVKKVFYLEDKYADLPDTIASKKMAQLVDIDLKRFKWDTVEAENIAAFIQGAFKK
jgi:dCMP deaminase